MATAAAHRLRRTRTAEQGTLDVVLPAGYQLQDTPDATARDQEEFTALAVDLAASQRDEPDPWAGSPFAFIKTQAPARRATLGTQLLTRWLAHCGLNPLPDHGPDHDLRLGDPVTGARIQVKVSTLWASGELVFQAVRDGDYDTLALLGLTPHDAYLWTPPRTVAVPQAAPATGWISFPLADPPRWLTPHGGNLAAGTRGLQP